MAAKSIFVLLISVVFLSGLASTSASSSPARIVGGIAFNVASSLFKWLWSLKSPTAKPGVSGRSLIKFEGGYNVETVFDGSKLGIEPYSVQASPTGELFILDSANSNVYKVSSPLSPYSRPKLLAGSPEGYSGHVDGKLREARMYHPRGMTLDDRGNVYVADTINMAIRKISDAGVTTIAGGKLNGGGSHVDGPSEDAKFSDDFDVVYIGSSCSLLVIDRGNQAIREIQLQYDDCSSEYQYDGSFHLGMAVLLAVGFFGYMLALLQQKIRALFVSKRQDPRTQMKSTMAAPYQRPPRTVIPPLMPDEDDPETSEEGFFRSFGRLILNTGSSAAEILGGLIFWGFRKKQFHHDQNLQHFQQQQPPRRYADPWPLPDSYVIQDEDEPPPSAEARTPTSGMKTYAFMNKDLDSNPKLRQKQMHQQWQHQQQLQQRQHMQQQQLQQQQQQQQQRQSAQQQQQRQSAQQQQRQNMQQQQRQFSIPKGNYCEQSSETNEIVFGAVQEQDGRREAVVIKSVDYSDPSYNHHNIRSRINYMGYSSYGYS
ncbi:hypothetical protein Ancab_023370 [Ancistrocladus abbreviatus]